MYNQLFVVIFLYVVTRLSLLGVMLVWLMGDACAGFAVVAATGAAAAAAATAATAAAF